VEVLRPFSLVFGGGCMHYSPPKSVSKGDQFWGFHCPRVRGVLGGNPSIPLDSTSFGGP
jgi:hypothetical protein